MLAAMRTRWSRAKFDRGCGRSFDRGRLVAMIAAGIIAAAQLSDPTRAHGMQITAPAATATAPAPPPPAPLKAPPPPPPKAPPPPPPKAPPPVPVAPPPAPGTITAPPAPAPPPPPPTEIAALAAFLFHDNGVIDRDDIAIEPQARHIPTGALDAPTAAGPAGPSHATLIVVEVGGLAAGARPVTVSLSASSKKDDKVLLKKSVRLPRRANGDTAPTAMKVPFVLNDTGCDSVRVVATISPASKGAITRLERLLPFHCGH